MKESYESRPRLEKKTIMGLSPMFKALIALSNEEAHYVGDLLVDAGINAEVNDVEPAVWIDTLHIDRAKRVLDAYPLADTEWGREKRDRFDIGKTGPISDQVGATHA